jgi:hypothetical protein
MAAVELMVIDVETRSSGIPSSRTSMSSRLSMATPDAAHLAQRVRVVGVVADLRRQVEGHRQAGRSALQQVPVAAVRLGRGAEARVLPHRPQAVAVPRPRGGRA